MFPPALNYMLFFQDLSPFSALSSSDSEAQQQNDGATAAFHTATKDHPLTHQFPWHNVGHIKDTRAREGRAEREAQQTLRE